MKNFKSLHRTYNRYVQAIGFSTVANGWTSMRIRPYSETKNPVGKIKIPGYLSDFDIQNAPPCLRSNLCILSARYKEKSFHWIEMRYYKGERKISWHAVVDSDCRIYCDFSKTAAQASALMQAIEKLSGKKSFELKS